MHKLLKDSFTKCRRLFKEAARSRKSILFLVCGIGLVYIPDMNRHPLHHVSAKPLTASTKKSFVAEAVARSGPAVVTLETQRTVVSQNTSSFPPELLMDPYLQRFFGVPRMKSQRAQVQRGQGSGVIFASEGLVLTNAHVVEKTDRLIIGMSDGQRVPGQVVGQDSLTDLAVIRLNGSGPWPTAPLGNSDKLVVGDWAIAVGNPFGLENTVTLGIISNLNRNVAQLGISEKRVELIQTDAAINPGNSGGPLLNAEGEVVGINTLVRSGPGAGLGFAIPINRAREIAKQLVEKGRAIHPIIGVSLGPINRLGSINSKALGQGAKVLHVMRGGPGEVGGLRVDDIIISAGRNKIKGPADVVNAINRHGINSPLSFEIKRGLRILELYITPLDMRTVIRR